MTSKTGFQKRFLSGLINQEKSTPNVNAEFNEYMEYYTHLIQLKSTGSILIVEDDPMCRWIIENAIKEYNPKIKRLTAASAAEALSILRTTPCDLVISDYFLEGAETGLDLCQKIHTLSPHSKCIMISSMTFFQYQKMAENAKLQPQFMEKPVSSGSIKKYLISFFEETFS
jgi:YesN/AraC family two-component response regulator